MADDVKQQILLQSQKLFQSKGLGKISMDDVAKAIGKGKSTLYYYFKSKEDLFSAVMDMEVNEIIVTSIKNMNTVDSFQEKLLAFAKVKYEMWQRRKSFFMTIEQQMNAAEILQIHQMKRSLHFTYVQKEKLVLLPVFLNAISKNEIQHLEDSSIDLYMTIFLSSLRGIVREHLISEEMKSSEVLKQFCSLFYNGLI